MPASPGEPRGTNRDAAGTVGTLVAFLAGRRAIHGGAQDPDRPGRETTEVTMTTATTTPTERRLSPAVLVGGAFALTTLLNILVHVGEIVFTDHDPHAPEGAIESIQSVAVVGGVGI